MCLTVWQMVLAAWHTSIVHYMVEKNTKKDIRVHFVAKLAAIDTSERDRALLELEKERTEMRELQLRHTELNVRLQLQKERIEQLEADNR